jgi:hypothetical protein
MHAAASISPLYKGFGVGTIGAESARMQVPVAAVAIVAVLLGAAALGLVHAESAPAAKGEPAPLPAVVAMPTQQTLPPNHPPIGTGGSLQGMQDSVSPTPDENPAITWKAPAGWAAAPNPNAMRIATYHPTPETDVSVARAGGSTDANIQRWVGQFDDAGPDKHTERSVHGLDMKIVEVSGTYAGGGMTSAMPSEPHHGWALVGVVVETPGTHYFFKMIGPADQVRAARASFDTMISSVTPS